ncbi:MAG: hypothetical protein J6S67_19210 [Methanobrevibacter sp.]|nr:hypothetical protein [Methanobrevibacter sp.]
MLSKFNSQKSVDWGVNTEGYVFKKASDLKLETKYSVKGLYISADNGFGEGAVIITDGFMVNCPQRMVEKFKQIMGDPEAVESIKAGKETFHVETYYNKRQKKDLFDIVFD